MLQFLGPYCEANRHIYKAITIASTLLVTSATNERSFSYLKLIKTYHHSTMEYEMLADLGCLSLNREIASALSLKDLIEKFKDKARRIEL